MGDDNVIELHPGQGRFLYKQAKERCRCSYNKFVGCWVDESTRTLQCRKCGSVIEPFDYVLGLAGEEDDLLRSLKGMAEKKQTLKAQIDLLEQQLRDLGAEVRKKRRKVE